MCDNKFYHHIVFVGTFDYLEVKDKETKYPGLRVSYLHSSIFLAPKCHCDPNSYLYDDNLANKTVNAHHWINSVEPDTGCEGGSKYEKGIRYRLFCLVVFRSEKCHLTK